MHTHGLPSSPFYVLLTSVRPEDGETVMDGSAEVIPFRPRRAREGREGGGSDGQERLSRALTLLDAALAEQRHAMEQFRLAIGDLGRAVGGLEAGLIAYGDELSCVGHDLDRLAIEARALEAWADRVLSQHA